jgi:DNA polymerase III sliding clamp (beta) subunit (PCNA family)
MNFTVEIEKLKKALSDASVCLSKNKEKNSIMANYYISVTDNVLQLTASNQTMQFTTKVEVESDGSGKFYCVAMYLTELRC